MRKNGFTLIELLAVIVILAIIALIATPIILGIINDAREKANERSVELYAAAVKNAIAAYQLRTGNEIKAGTYTKETLPFEVEYDGKVECTSITLSKDSNVSLEGCTVNGGEKTYNYGKKEESETSKICELSDEDSNEKYSVGDIVTCTLSESTEQFYVIENEHEDTTEGMSMLAMYNLYVGEYFDTGTTYPLENPTGIQNPLAKGYVSDSGTFYGIVAFSNSMYWVDENYELLSQYGSSYPAFAYDNNSNLYQYITTYETYLKENGVNSASATVISYQQVNDLKTNKGNPSWLYSTSYWTGSVANPGYVWYIDSDGSFSSESYGTCGYGIHSYGVRPVITISTSEIQ